MYEKLRHELKQRGISANKLSMMSEISSPGLYAALNGTTPLWPGWRKRIAEALQMDENELFEEEEKK